MGLSFCNSDGKPDHRFLSGFSGVSGKNRIPNPGNLSGADPEHSPSVCCATPTGKRLLEALTSAEAQQFAAKKYGYRPLSEPLSSPTFLKMPRFENLLPPPSESRLSNIKDELTSLHFTLNKRLRFFFIVHGQAQVLTLIVHAIGSAGWSDWLSVSNSTSS